MRKFLLGLVAVATIASPMALVAAPASAATSDPPTMSAPNVARGKTIQVKLNPRGSRVLNHVKTLWDGGRRVNDWSPKPGLYKVRSVITYQLKTTTRRDVWVPDVNCADYSSEGYDDNGDGDYDDEWDQAPYDACAEYEYGYWDTRTTTKFGAKRKVTRYDYARVLADETPGCVSRTEFRAVKDGMTQARVHSIFGTAGRVEHIGSGGVGREYNTCTGNEWSYVSVDYNPRVWFKWQYIDY